jgi:hypothetical protein
VAEEGRISFELPAVPYSLRGFIERAVKDERFMLSVVESPVYALRAAGVPVKTECLAKTDCDRLVRVLGKLRNLVASGRIPSEFRFEEIFTIGPDVQYEQTSTSTDSYIEKNFDHSTEGHDSEKKSSTEEGIYTNFKTFGRPERPGDDIIAPLISPGDLAAIVTLMQAKIVATYGQ